MMLKYPFIKNTFGKEELKQVEETINSVNPLEKVSEFENKFSSYIGSKYSVACNSGTSALELLFNSLIHNKQLEQMDRIIIPSFTFSGVANAVINSGLIPIFADIGCDFNIKLEKTTDFKKAKAILAIHTFGKPCNINYLKDLSEDKNMILLEDCAEACGASVNNNKVGTFGLASIFSFDSTKNMTTSDGGMLVTNEDSLNKTARLIKDNGITRLDNIHRISLIEGHNYRLSYISAAIGIAQLSKLDKMNKLRLKNANNMNKELKSISEQIITPTLDNNIAHVYQLYTIILKDQAKRDSLVNNLNNKSIEARVYFEPPIHSQKLYCKHYKLDQLSNTDYISKRVLTLPINSTNTNEELKEIAHIFSECILKL